AEPLGEKRERRGAALAYLARESASIDRVGLESFADVRDQRAVDADERVRDCVRPQVVGAGASRVGDQSRQRFGGGGEDVVLAGEQGWAGGDHARERDQLRRRRFVRGGEEASGLEDELAEGGDDRLPARPLADRGEELLLEGLEAAVDQVFLAGEV